MKKINKKDMNNFNQITNIIIQKYDKAKQDTACFLMNKNKLFKYNSDDYILSDTRSIDSKKRVIFIDYLIPTSTMYCMIDCKILQSKSPLKNGTRLITHAKDFEDNIYISIDKNNLEKFQISSFETSKGIKVTYKNEEQFIESFNNALDQMIKYLEQQKTNHKILYYISKIVKTDPEEYIDTFIQKINLAKFQKSSFSLDIITQQANLSMSKFNERILQLYSHPKYQQQLFPYLNNKFKLELEKYLDICKEIYSQQKYNQWFANTHIVYYYQQSTSDDGDYQKGKMEDNNVYINHYGLVAHLKEFKRDQVFEIYSKIYHLIPHELAHIADIQNMLNTFSNTKINLDKQNKHSQTYRKQHIKICGQQPYLD